MSHDPTTDPTTDLTVPLQHVTQQRDEVEVLLDAWSNGDEEALTKLMPLVIDDLRRVARKHMAGERANHTLQPTALVNEVYLQLAGKQSVQWKNRAQFFAFLARMMRRILVDHWRSASAEKRGGDVEKIPLEDDLVLVDESQLDLLRLDEAMQRLEKLNERQAQLVELRVFGGLTHEEAAEVLGVTATTMKRDWRMAKIFLRRELAADAHVDATADADVG